MLLILNFFATVLLGSNARGLPPNPCPNIFRYESDASGELHGIVTLQNDLSGSYRLDLNMILPVRVNTNQNIAIARLSSVGDARAGKDVVFYVNFPRNDVIPEVDRIVFNGRVRCSMAHTLGSQFKALTFLSASSSFGVDAQPSAEQHPVRETSEHFSHLGTPGVAVHKLEMSDPDAFFVADSHSGGGLSQRQPQDVVHRLEPGKSTHFFNFASPGLEVHKLEMSDPDAFVVDSHYGGGISRPQDVVHEVEEPAQGTHFFNFGNGGHHPGHKLEMSDLESFLIDRYPTKEVSEPKAVSMRPVQSTTTPRPLTTESNRAMVECGVAEDIQPLVVHGKATSEGQYPWLVAMFHHIQKDASYKFRCGGNLITNNHVITAAHCVRHLTKPENLPNEDITLVLGKHNINTWATRSQIRAVREIYVHPDYRKPSDADIAIISMDRPVEYTAKIRPACLWSEPAESTAWREGVVVGWGRDEFFNEYVPEPKEVKMPIVSQEDCLRSDDRFLAFTSKRTFCAGNRDGSGVCNGDSGGGFVVKRNGRWTLRGIVSASLPDSSTRSCDVNNYMVFSDVGSFREWIQNVLAS